MKNLIARSALLASAIALSACQNMPSNQLVNGVAAQPVLKSKINSVGDKPMPMGQMYLRPVEGGMQVFGKLMGLPPGKTVAVHIHETGSCSNMGKAAGGHFNPANKPHGHPNSQDSHAGDMPNVTADANGVAMLNFVNTDITADMSGANSVYRRAIIVHNGVDDYVSQPSGNAGDRIACGVIEKM